MTIQLRNFSSETVCVQDMSFVVKGFTTKLFLQIFLNSVIYETFPIQNFLRIRYLHTILVFTHHTGIYAPYWYLFTILVFIHHTNIYVPYRYLCTILVFTHHTGIYTPYWYLHTILVFMHHMHTDHRRKRWPDHFLVGKKKTYCK